MTMGAAGPRRIRSREWTVAAGVLVFWTLAASGCGPSEGAAADDRRAGPSTIPSTSAASDPAAGWIVFTSDRSGNGDLFAVHPDSREIVSVVGGEAPESGARWDATRGRVVYRRLVGDSALLHADTVVLFRDPNGDAPPVWAPGGEWIAYAATRDGREDLFLARHDGSEERRLTDDDHPDRHPAWSPDGTHLAFVRRTGSGWDLHLIDLTEGGMPVRRVTRGLESAGHPSWSPDGTRIALDATFDGRSEIAMVEVADGTVTRLTDRPGNDLHPSWGPDGRITFAGEVDGNWDLWIVDPETRAPARLTADPGFDGEPVFVPGSAIGG